MGGDEGVFSISIAGTVRDGVVSEVIAIATVATLTGLHLTFSWLDHAVADHAHIQYMLKSAYRELMTMGLVSFILFCIQANGFTEGTALHEFESIHIMLFVLGIVFLLAILLLVGMSLLVAAEWDLVETKYAFDLAAYRELRTQLLELQVTLGLRSAAPEALLLTPAATPPTSLASSVSTDTRRCGCWCRHRHPTSSHGVSASRAALTANVSKTGTAGRIPSFWRRLQAPFASYRYFIVVTRIRFLEQRYKFLSKNGLPGAFSFAAYLRKCKHHAFRKLVEIPVSLWITLMLAISLDMYLRALWPNYIIGMNPITIVIGGATVVLAVSLLLFYKIRTVYWSVLHSSYRTPAASAPTNKDTKAINSRKRVAHARTLTTMGGTPGTPSVADGGGAAAATWADPIKAQKALFWFSYPVLMLRAMQGVVFGGSLIIALCARFWFEFADPATIFIPFLVLALVLLSMYVLRWVVPLYIITLHTGDLVDMRLLVEAVEKQRELERARREKGRREMRERAEREFAGRIPWRVKLARALDAQLTSWAITGILLVQFVLNAILVSRWLEQPHAWRVYVADLILVCLLALDQCLRTVAVGCRPRFCGTGTGRGCCDLSVWGSIFDFTVTSIALCTAIAAFILFANDATVSSSLDSEEHGPYAVGSDALMFFVPLSILRLCRSFLLCRTFRVHVRKSTSLRDARGSGVQPKGSVQSDGGTAPMPAPHARTRSRFPTTTTATGLQPEEEEEGEGQEADGVRYQHAAPYTGNGTGAFIGNDTDANIGNGASAGNGPGASVNVIHAPHTLSMDSLQSVVVTTPGHSGLHVAPGMELGHSNPSLSPTASSTGNGKGAGGISSGLGQVHALRSMSADDIMATRHASSSFAEWGLPQLSQRPVSTGIGTGIGAGMGAGMSASGVRHSGGGGHHPSVRDVFGGPLGSRGGVSTGVNSSRQLPFPVDGNSGSYMSPSPYLNGSEHDALGGMLQRATQMPAYRSDLVGASSHHHNRKDNNSSFYSEATLTETAARALASQIASRLVTGSRNGGSGVYPGSDAQLPPLRLDSLRYEAMPDPMATMTEAQRARMGQIANLIGSDACLTDADSVDGMLVPPSARDSEREGAGPGHARAPSNVRFAPFTTASGSGYAPRPQLQVTHHSYGNSSSDGVAQYHTNELASARSFTAGSLHPTALKHPQSGREGSTSYDPSGLWLGEVEEAEEGESEEESTTTRTQLPRAGGETTAAALAQGGVAPVVMRQVAGDVSSEGTGSEGNVGTTSATGNDNGGVSHHQDAIRQAYLAKPSMERFGSATRQRGGSSPGVSSTLSHLAATSSQYHHAATTGSLDTPSPHATANSIQAAASSAPVTNNNNRSIASTAAAPSVVPPTAAGEVSPAGRSLVATSLAAAVATAGQPSSLTAATMTIPSSLTAATMTMPSIAVPGAGQAGSGTVGAPPPLPPLRSHRPPLAPPLSQASLSGTPTPVAAAAAAAGDATAVGDKRWDGVLERLRISLHEAESAPSPIRKARSGAASADFGMTLRRRLESNSGGGGGGQDRDGSWGLASPLFTAALTPTYATDASAVAAPLVESVPVATGSERVVRRVSSGYTAPTAKPARSQGSHPTNPSTTTLGCLAGKELAAALAASVTGPGGGSEPVDARVVPLSSQTVGKAVKQSRLPHLSSIFSKR